MKLIYICNTCGKETEKLSIHHILPKSLGGRDIDTNIVKICNTCHTKIHGNEKLFSSSLIKKSLNDLKNEGHLLGRPLKVNNVIISTFNDLKNEGYSLKEISKITNYSVGTIHKYLREKIGSTNG
jgi:hypothetical protein